MQDFVGKYQVLERIASGGMADVYRALATGPGGFRKVVAIKRIREHMSGDAEFVDMFVSEATLAARLDHPNIVQVFEFNRDRRQYYLVMEFVQGLDLKTALERIPAPWSPELACHVASKALFGLQYAHELTDGQGRPLGVIHRDISPHNLLLSCNGEVKVADFGIAKMRDAVSHTQANMVRGKLPYLSPEQARGEPLDARSDLYSLGLVLWETLTGVRRFGRGNGADPLAEVMAGRFLAPSVLEPSIGPAVDRLLQGLLEPRRERRFQSAAEAREAIDRLFPRDASGTLAGLIRAHQTPLPPPGEVTLLLARDERSDTWSFGADEASRGTVPIGQLVTRPEPGPGPEPVPGPATDTVPVRPRPASVVSLPRPRRKPRRLPLARAAALVVLALFGLSAGFWVTPMVRNLAVGDSPAWQTFSAELRAPASRPRVRLVGGQFQSDRPDTSEKAEKADTSDTSEKSTRSRTSDRSDRPDRPDKPRPRLVGGQFRPDTSDTSTRSRTSGTSDRSDRSGTSDRSDPLAPELKTSADWE